MALYTGTKLDLNIDLDTEIDLSGSSVVVVVKSKSQRLEKDASGSSGSYVVTLDSTETTDSGTYILQPVIKYTDGNEIPCSVSSFELLERI